MARDNDGMTPPIDTMMNVFHGLIQGRRPFLRASMIRRVRS